MVCSYSICFYIVTSLMPGPSATCYRCFSNRLMSHHCVLSLKVIAIMTDSMADDFSQSLTPPVSPFAADSLYELTPAQPPYFCCSETKEDPAGALSAESYTARGSLKRYSHDLSVKPNHKNIYSPLEVNSFHRAFFCAKRNGPNENC